MKNLRVSKKEVKEVLMSTHCCNEENNECCKDQDYCDHDNKDECDCDHDECTCHKD